MRRTSRTRDRAKARNRSRRRRYTIGPFSYLDRLRLAALGDHVCRPYSVRLED